jgi:hypothetical protein
MSSGSCFCGCDRFRFMLNHDDFKQDDQTLWYNICSNCKHSLGQHVDIVRSKQAD